MNADLNSVGAIVGGTLLAAGLAVSWFFVRRHDAAEKAQAEAHLAHHPALDAAGFGRTYFPADQVDLARRLRELLAPHLPLDLARLHPDDRLVEDLRMDALDSMSTAEFILAVEEEFQVEIPAADAAKIFTLGDLTRHVAARRTPESG
jgi:acyl carrier protein